MSDDFEVLLRCPLFEGIGPKDARAMLGCLGARTVEAARGASIFLEGSPAEYVGIVLSGAAQVLRDDFYGNRAIQAVLQPGELFGETFACAGLDRLPVAVEAAQPSRILLIRLRRITETCSNACEFHNRMVMNLLKAMAAKNLQLNRKIEITSRRTTREKLMAYLLNQARLAQSGSFTIPFDRQALADYLCVERSALSAEIGRLRREGVLESEKSHFKLLTRREGSIEGDK